MDLIIALELLAIIVLGAPVFAHYLRELSYDLFCVVWNIVAFIVNTAVFLFGRRR